MGVNYEELEKIIKEAFPRAEFILTDDRGDGNHYNLEIADPSFIGQTRIGQHKMVNNALKTCLKSALHALSIKTKLPNF